MPQDPIRKFRLTMPTVLAVLLGAFVVPPASAQGSSEAGAAPAQPSTAKVEADTYLVELTAGGPYKVGATGSVKVSLTAKAGFHINDQYPYRFNTSPPVPGVSYPKPVLERADGQFEEKAAVFHLPFVASHTGQFTVGGVLKLSVCSPASCIVQKAPLAISVTVQ
ncbi:MAG: hypothetical protein ABI895_22860 [Deltaproteobacteria bacterium]